MSSICLRGVLVSHSIIYAKSSLIENDGEIWNFPILPVFNFNYLSDAQTKARKWKICSEASRGLGGKHDFKNKTKSSTTWEAALELPISLATARMRRNICDCFRHGMSLDENIFMDGKIKQISRLSHFTFSTPTLWETFSGQLCSTVFFLSVEHASFFHIFNYWIERGNV